MSLSQRLDIIGSYYLFTCLRVIVIELGPGEAGTEKQAECIIFPLFAERLMPGPLPQSGYRGPNGILLAAVIRCPPMQLTLL